MITNIDILKKDLIRIENIKSFLVDIPKLHPDNPKYIQLWTNYTKWCIEGFWAWDNGGWRFMPPTLFFYGNFVKIEDEIDGVRYFVKPTVSDLDWHIHYAYLEAQGFSGFKKDDIYSCDIALLHSKVYARLEKSSEPTERKRFLELHSKNGKKKIYQTPREVIRRLHTEDLGRPLYYNNAKNLMMFRFKGPEVKH